MLSVLDASGVRGIENNWFASFLNGWTQYVEHCGIRSSLAEFQRGLIQGENNSQLLFSLVIDHVCAFIKHCKYHLFADDLQLYASCRIQDIPSMIDAMNEDIRCVARFCEIFGLQLNPMKTQAILISSPHVKRQLNDMEIPAISVMNSEVKYCEAVRNLGFTIDDVFSNQQHVKKVVRNVNFCLSRLAPMRRILRPDTKATIVKSIILPLFDFADVIYNEYDTHGSHSKSTRLEIALNDCIRFIRNLHYCDHVSNHRRELGLMKLTQRRVLHTAIMIHKILHGNTPQYLTDILSVNSGRTRACGDLIHRKPRNRYDTVSLRVAGSLIWNAIPKHIRDIESSFIFRKMLWNHFLPNDSD